MTWFGRYSLLILLALDRLVIWLVYLPCCILIAFSASMWVFSCLLPFSTHGLSVARSRDDIGPEASALIVKTGFCIWAGWLEICCIDIVSKGANLSSFNRFLLLQELSQARTGCISPECFRLIRMSSPPYQWKGPACLSFIRSIGG